MHNIDEPFIVHYKAQSLLMVYISDKTYTNSAIKGTMQNAHNV